MNALAAKMNAKRRARILAHHQDGPNPMPKVNGAGV